MANRSRTLDPSLWQKPDFMRATPLAREVWIGLICTCADDEGRFEADVMAITHRLFPRSHPATEEGVQECFTYWQRVGWLTFYEAYNTRYGFLHGWFEHQYIKDPEPSSFPAPPVLVASWRDVHAIKRWHVSERGGNSNTHFRTVLRDFAQAVQDDGELTVKQVRTKYGLSTDKVLPELKGIQENSIQGNDDATTHQRGLAMYTLARRANGSDPSICFEYDNCEASYGEAATCCAAMITLAKFQDEKQKPRGSSVASYLLSAARGQAEKLEALNGDRILAAFIAANKDRPSDPIGGLQWDDKLARYREAANAT